MRKLAVLLFIATAVSAQDKPVVIAVSTLLDGRGNVVRNTRIVVEHGTIARIDAQASPVTLDLRGLTVMPGFIDTYT